ncbi:MAG: HD domain-containing protein [Candidatus Scalindua sp.]|jgi:HD-GYP domain-containing protein (c-di-GMP phosphodiesterase class II)|nr:HD domain-containing protein [Candidatus Scalindua sp.]MBT5306009.1 HD domain-containing protein [Candidatus Scalindua sp.]MBT6047002.1 HD domain-containing protein [Candidatus Scalindua sp.]MBT6230308.1 HD domain-containing protein [Candidatus Scalindua sp.]MBT6563226.1 HD domain-containing protein [Candidatus Scalindua sp.]
MARLSDLIKQGKIPEKKQDEEVKIRNLERLKEDKDAVKTKQEGGSSSEEISEMNLPTEAREDKLPDKITLENISLPSEDELTAPSKEGLEEQKRIEGLYATIYDFIEGVISSLKRKKRFTIEKGLEIVKDIVHTENATNILYGKAVQGKGIPDNLSAHSANVCIYSLILGKGVDYSQEKLIELGITALLHDIGMVFIPNEIVSKKGKLTTSELQQLRKHPYYTFKILQTLGEKYLWIAKTASQEQERENGQGYPNGLKGDEIHDYAKIIGIADVYEALTHNRPQRRGYMPHDAVKLILGTQKDLFSNEVKRLLLTKLSCFPLGSYITLNSKAICKVIEIYEDAPLRPTVEILFDSQNRRLQKKKIIRLTDAPLLYVTGTVYESDLPQ